MTQRCGLEPNKEEYAVANLGKGAKGMYVDLLQKTGGKRCTRRAHAWCTF